jgi:hypothetical protein
MGFDEKVIQMVKCYFDSRERTFGKFSEGSLED